MMAPFSAHPLRNFGETRHGELYNHAWQICQLTEKKRQLSALILQPIPPNTLFRSLLLWKFHLSWLPISQLVGMSLDPSLLSLVPKPGPSIDPVAWQLLPPTNGAPAAYKRPAKIFGRAQIFRFPWFPTDFSYASIRTEALTLGPSLLHWLSRS